MVIKYLNLHIISYVRPLLEYGSCLWPPYLLKNILMIEKMLSVLLEVLFCATSKDFRSWLFSIGSIKGWNSLRTTSHKKNTDSQSLLEKTINDELMLINEWFQVNLLSLNVSKTTYIIFKTSGKWDTDLNCFIQNSKLLRQYDTKFLGVIISSDWKWNKHISVVIAKTSKSLGIISKAQHLVPQHTTRMLCMTLVEPYFNYCNIVWASFKKKLHILTSCSEFKRNAVVL